MIQVIFQDDHHDRIVFKPCLLGLSHLGLKLKMCKNNGWKKIMCKNSSWKIRTRTSGEGWVLEIRTHPDRRWVV